MFLKDPPVVKKPGSVCGAAGVTSTRLPGEGVQLGLGDEAPTLPARLVYRQLP